MNGGYASWRFAFALLRACGRRRKVNTGSKPAEGRTGITAFPIVLPAELTTLLIFLFSSFRAVERSPALNCRPFEEAALLASGVSVYRVGQRQATNPDGFHEPPLPNLQGISVTAVEGSRRPREGSSETCKIGKRVVSPQPVRHPQCPYNPWKLLVRVIRVANALQVWVTSF